MAWSVSGSKTKARTRVRALLNSVKVKPTEVLFSQVLYGIACIDCIDIASVDCIDIACIVTRNPPSSFSQDTGFANFSDGRWVAQTIREILSGQLDPASLPLLRVVKAQDGRLFSLDNRRLYCFQACGVRWINVEMAETREGEVNEEYLCKRFGSGNGTTSQAIILMSFCFIF